MRSIPGTLKRAAAKTRDPIRANEMTEMLTVTADGGLMWDPRQPLQVLAPRMTCKDADGNMLGQIISLNIWTGDAIQAEVDEEKGVRKYDDNGHPVLKHVRVSRVEIDIPPR